MKLAQFYLDGTRQPVDTEKEGLHPATDSQWLEKLSTHTAFSYSTRTAFIIRFHIITHELTHITDTQLERNALMADVYPKIKDYCREKHGLEFQVGRVLIRQSYRWAEFQVGRFYA